MYKKLLFATVATVFAVTASSARDITECSSSDSTEDTPQWLVGDICMSIDQIEQRGGVPCSSVFNIPEWEGRFFSAYDPDRFSDDNHSCHLTIRPGYYLDTDFVFDEDRSGEMFKQCEGGLYCPGVAELSYDEVKEIMGELTFSAVECPIPDDIFRNPELTDKLQLLWEGVRLGISTPVGATSVDDCYIEPGTYYDATGQFEITNNCAY